MLRSELGGGSGGGKEGGCVCWLVKSQHGLLNGLALLERRGFGVDWTGEGRGWRQVNTLVLFGLCINLEHCKIYQPSRETGQPFEVSILNP